MSAAVASIREAEAAGALVTMEGEQLKLIRGTLLPAALLDKLRTSKAEILEVLKRNQKAKESGFLTMMIGEAYERQVSDNGHVFVIRNESGKWDAWRESWGREESSTARKSTSSKDIRMDVPFEMALLKATHYIDNLSRWKGASRYEPTN